MKTSDLFTEPFAFTQTPLLTPEKFREELEKRHLRLAGLRPRVAHLELLHRKGLLAPWYEVTSEDTLREASPIRAKGWARRTDTTHWNFGKEWRYGWYQLLRALEISDVAHRFELRNAAGTQLRQERWRMRPEGRMTPVRPVLPDLVLVALSAIESHYLRRVVGRLKVPSGTFEEYEAFDRAFDAAEMARRVGMSPDEIRRAAEHLLQRPLGVDPLGGWHQVIDQGPARWDELEGEALIAMDHRIAAEVLLMLYEDLADRGLAQALPRDPDTLGYRLRRGHPSLERLLTEFGLSTRPLALVIVPGETEEFFLPRVAEKLGFPIRPHLVDMRSAKGESRRLNAYIAKTVAYRIGEELRPGIHLTSARPTRVFVAMDPEKLYKTAEKRRAVKTAWVSDVEREMLPAGYRVSRGHLRQQICLRVWHHRLPFEFAHFSDSELSAGLTRLYPGQYNVDDLIEAIRLERQTNEPTINRPAKRKVDKVELAKLLWPALEARLDSAIIRRVEPNVPIAKLVIDAYRFALNASLYRYFSVPLRRTRD